MRKPILFALVVVSLALVTSGPAAAQVAPTPTDTPTDSSASNSSSERIDSQTVIVSSRVETVNNTTTAYITLSSSAVQTVTLTDAGAFLKGGEVPYRDVNLGKGETSTYAMPVTRSNGYVGLSISTEETRIYSEIIQRPSGSSGSSPFGQTGPTAGWLGGVSVVMAMTALAAIQVKRKNPEKPEDMT